MRRDENNVRAPESSSALLRASAQSAGRIQTPRATYRIQFRRDFTLRQATELVAYWASLGVSHLYASPLLKALPGSAHGYDVCDPTRINPELGSEEDLRLLVNALRGSEMGLVLDIVPNHMGIGRDNPWWWDVLKHGEKSRFARFFDVDWNSPDPALRGKVLVPVLAADCEAVLAQHDLRLESDADGDVVLHYFDHQFPIASGSLTTDGESRTDHGSVLAAANENPDDLRAVLARQHYRLVHWPLGDGELNYRRFFTISTLAGVRVEDPEIFSKPTNSFCIGISKGGSTGFA